MNVDKPNMFKCNRCEKKWCSIPSNKKKFTDTRECGIWVDVDRPFKLPMLLHLMTDESKIDDTTELLEKSGFKIEEIGKYPFFRLRL